MPSTMPRARTAKAPGRASPQGCWAPAIDSIGTPFAQQHLRNVLAHLDVPTLGQPEAFIPAKEGLLDAHGNIGAGSRGFLQDWMNATDGREGLASEGRRAIGHGQPK
jgi:hypothetical protein